MLFRKIAIGFVIMAGIVGLFNWQSIKNSHWKLFPFYLFTLAIFTILCYWLTPSVANKFSALVVIPFEFFFIYWLFYKNLQSKFVIIGGFVYFIFFIIELFFIEITTKNLFLSLSYSVGNIILLIFIFIYFYQLSFSDEILTFYRKQMFWVCLGFLIFYLGTLPYYGLFNLMLQKFYDILVVYTWVQVSLDCIMNILFAASFIWGKEK
ncbi:MAG: hypothetical protein U5M51_06400 [Emticicia sp.]|nr:hypothetical protein [Emticicia sp.]